MNNPETNEPAVFEPAPVPTLEVLSEFRAIVERLFDSKAASDERAARLDALCERRLALQIHKLSLEVAELERRLRREEAQRENPAQYTTPAV